ncbi:hypothetical protein DUNSADRAFT_17187 [Dunaliella salina]|uniref:Encoded protein n=1 Tax=Dunaliella salina TaxID=3046 RepID=A0ABQ7G294_DUNSA|nr:hypothetical protein DUNSADRAFT_17187 [Dunaliella salina]|eukprot:KAF5828721.1 hypothetical protein DUNSADRAFT_17187 [Dunaliella salina]
MTLGLPAGFQGPTGLLCRGMQEGGGGGTAMEIVGFEKFRAAWGSRWPRGRSRSKEHLQLRQHVWGLLAIPATPKEY